MSSIEILNEIENTHGLRNLAKRGLISASLFAYRDIYLEFDAYKKQGYNTTEAAHHTSEKFRISEKTVYKAKRIMEA